MRDSNNNQKEGQIKERDWCEMARKRYRYGRNEWTTGQTEKNNERFWERMRGNHRNRYRPIERKGGVAEELKKKEKKGLKYYRAENKEEKKQTETETGKK